MSKLKCYLQIYAATDLYENEIFFVSPRDLADVRIELIMPPLTTLVAQKRRFDENQVRKSEKYIVFDSGGGSDSSSSETVMFVRIGTVVAIRYWLTCLPVLFVFSSEAIELQCFVPFSTMSLTISSSWRKTIFRVV